MMQLRTMQFIWMQCWGDGWGPGASAAQGCTVGANVVLVARER
jgi:hypothetical protein